jgi:hypothetical protein
MNGHKKLNYESVFSAFVGKFCYNNAMKLSPKAHSKVDETSVSDMAKMRSLLSEKEGVIQEKDDVIKSQKHRIAILEEHIRQAAKRFAPSNEKTSPSKEICSTKLKSKWILK